MPQLNLLPTPLRIQFVLTSLPVGGAETLLLSLIRRMDRQSFAPEVVCLKDPGAMGDEVASEVPLHANLLKSKWDTRVVGRLINLFKQREADVVVTIGAGDKMFWGRLAAKLAGVPVICSALHSTGWPDGIGTLNRWLTPITHAFIAVAKPHAEFLVTNEKLPRERVFLVPNGVDTDRFRPNHARRAQVRDELQIPLTSQVIGIVAALREEKNHSQFVDAAQEVHRHFPTAHFVIVGEGPERSAIEDRIHAAGLMKSFHCLGSRGDTERLLAAMDIFCLTSRNEANPVSILEALACGVPAVAPDVGSISQTVIHRKTGLLTEAGSATSTGDALLQLLGNPAFASGMGLAGRQLVRSDWSLDAMVSGYEHLLRRLYIDQRRRRLRTAAVAPQLSDESTVRATTHEGLDAKARAAALPSTTATEAAGESRVEAAEVQNFVSV